MEVQIGKKQELLDLARAMLEDRVHLIEGVRKICSLRFSVEQSDDEIFFPIRAIESETDSFPLSSLRDSCSQEYLERSDAGLAKHLDQPGNPPGFAGVAVAV